MHPNKRLWLAVWVFLLANMAWADGIFFSRSPSVRDIYEPDQKAFIYYADGLEDMVLQVSYKGSASDFAWVVPIPSRPRVDTFDAKLFRELSLLTPLQKKSMTAGGFGGRGGLDSVTVLERRQVGVYDVSVLTSPDPQALVNWLQQNGYAFPSTGSGIVANYVSRGWVFVAARITVNNTKVQQELREGVLQPLRLTFETPQIIYPMKLTSLSGQRTEVLLYVAAPYRVQAVHFREEWGGLLPRPAALRTSHPTLGKLVKRKSHLTKLRAMLDPSEMQDDVVLGRR